MSQVVVNVEGTPEGAEIEVPGLGVFLNGSRNNLSAQQIEEYAVYLRVHHGVDEDGVSLVRPKWPLVIGSELPVDDSHTRTAKAAGKPTKEG